MFHVLIPNMQDDFDVPYGENMNPLPKPSLSVAECKQLTQPSRIKQEWEEGRGKQLRYVLDQKKKELREAQNELKKIKEQARRNSRNAYKTERRASPNRDRNERRQDRGGRRSPYQ